MGYSQIHSSSVSQVLNIQTGAVTPQYHLVNDDWFNTVSNMNSASLPPAMWHCLVAAASSNWLWAQQVSQGCPNRLLVCFWTICCEGDGSWFNKYFRSRPWVGMKQVSKALREHQFSRENQFLRSINSWGSYCYWGSTYLRGRLCASGTYRPNPRYFVSEWSNMAWRRTQKLRAGKLNNAFIQSLEWNDLTSPLNRF